MRRHLKNRGRLRDRAPGPALTVQIDEEYERKARSRQAKLQRVFTFLDGQYPEVRRLVGFYGFPAVSQELSYCNPEDVPKRLGREKEYREHCARYDDDLRAR